MSTPGISERTTSVTSSIWQKANSLHWKFRRILQAKTLAARCYIYDFKVEKKHLSWKRVGPEYWKISAELIFQYHKIEKGLCLPGPKRFFGRDAVTATMNLMDEWKSKGLPLNHQVYAAATETLRAYRRRLEITPPPEQYRTDLIERVDAFISSTTPDPHLLTPIGTQQTTEATYDELLKLAIARRSVRSFSSRAVDPTLIQKAAEIAQLSPSACNRQPWRVHIYRDRQQVDTMLKLQNGNQGFRDEIPVLAIITSDMNCFFDASERIEPTLDSGLFLMSFLLALQSLGLASCCLNWCVRPSMDKKAHAAGNIPENHKIGSFLAIGYASDTALVPLSARRPINDVLVLH